jgi:hypothetical protein
MIVLQVGFAPSISLSVSTSVTYWRRSAGLVFLPFTSANGFSAVSFNFTA